MVDFVDWNSIVLSSEPNMILSELDLVAHALGLSDKVVLITDLARKSHERFQEKIKVKAAASNQYPQFVIPLQVDLINMPSIMGTDFIQASYDDLPYTVQKRYWLPIFIFLLYQASFFHFIDEVALQGKNRRPSREKVRQLRLQSLENGQQSKAIEWLAGKCYSYAAERDGFARCYEGVKSRWRDLAYEGIYSVLANSTLVM